MEAITEEHVDLLFATNVRGLIVTVSKALPLLHAGSSVILGGSTDTMKGTPGFSVYGATKAAVRNLARSWALDPQATGIRVNVLGPGPTDTPMLHAGLSNAEVAGIGAWVAERTPSRRLGEASDLAGAAVFLASDDSAFVNGTELFVDGGYAQV